MSLWDQINNFWHGLFGKPAEKAAPARAPDMVDTAPLRPETLELVSLTKTRQALEVGSAQSTGLERENNEDSILSLFTTASGEEPLPDFGLFCVADGAGGLGYGELASSIAVKAVARSLIEDAFIRAMDVETQDNTQSIAEAAERAVLSANAAVMESANGGVTTLTLAILMENRMTIAHVGDSRAYIFNGQSMKQLTRDHSYAWRLVEIGQIEAQEASTHPKRNQLWNAVGKGANLIVEVETHPFPQGGHLLLCSDGLWGEVGDLAMQSIIAASTEPNDTCDQLVRAANEAGGADNISALLIKFPAN